MKKKITFIKIFIIILMIVVVVAEYKKSESSEFDVYASTHFREPAEIAVNSNESMEQEDGIQNESDISAYLIYVIHKGPEPEDYKSNSLICRPEGIINENYNEANWEDAIKEFYKKWNKNNLMVVNSAVRAAVNLIELEPGVKPIFIDMDDKGWLYLADSKNIITVMDTNSVLDELKTLSTEPYGICDMMVEKSGERIFCALNCDSYTTVGIIGVDEYFFELIPLENSQDNSIIRGIVIDGEGEYVYVTLASETGGKVAIININTCKVEETVKVGLNPSGLEITPDGKKLYVVNEGEDNVSVIDIYSRQIITTVEVGLSPVKVALTPDGARAYVTNMGNNSVSIIDTEFNTVLTTLSVGKKPMAIRISEDGKMAFVANYGSDDVTMIDVEKNSIVNTTVPFLGGRPVDIEMKPFK